ncbi:MAG TPA: protein-L-isoaspartate(D-aspartate) O-methyltransferase [Candidatus Krumholzibacteria bacterium]|nr:protein-L-isoaspartate(D-aspartate) O-methyltransferase [Candidatus Krumholzibacteria bacterium]HRX50746.1 protein-L-isoaspartate(D-aspartate) O-methyltransferase [Candidatus Krumholzibacteria bacterium]
MIRGARDFSVARSRMVAEQLEEAGITDRAVLQVMREIPRHLFVPQVLRHRAYHGCALPIGYEQTISQPFIVGLMTALLELSGTETVLEVGTGSGYQAAILSRLAARVVTVERVEALALRSSRLLEELGCANVEVYASDASDGVPEHGPYQAVITTACAPRLPDGLFHQLAEGGRLVIPIARGEEQVLYRYRKLDGEPRIERSVPCRFVPLLEGVVRKEDHA